MHPIAIPTSDNLRPTSRRHEVQTEYNGYGVSITGQRRQVGRAMGHACRKRHGGMWHNWEDPDAARTFKPFEVGSWGSPVRSVVYEMVALAYAQIEERDSRDSRKQTDLPFLGTLGKGLLVRQVGVLLLDLRQSGLEWHCRRVAFQCQIGTYVPPLRKSNLLDCRTHLDILSISILLASLLCGRLLLGVACIVDVDSIGGNEMRKFRGAGTRKMKSVWSIRERAIEAPQAAMEGGDSPVFLAADSGFVVSLGIFLVGCWQDG